MVTKWNLAGLKLMYKKSLCLSIVEFTQARGVRSMAMWGSVPVNNLIVPVLHLQIGLGNDVLNKLIDFIYYDAENLSTGEEVSHSTTVALNQVITKIRQNRQIWDVNDGVMLQHKSMQIKQPQATKESTLGLNDNIVITITLAEKFVKKKNKKEKICRRNILIINQEMHVDQESEISPNI